MDDSNLSRQQPQVSTRQERSSFADPLPVQVAASDVADFDMNDNSRQVPFDANDSMISAQESRQSNQPRGSQSALEESKGEFLISQRALTKEYEGFVKSKLDLYNILSSEGQLYLPPYSECSLDFMKALLSGKKKYLLNEHIRLIKVPQFEEFSTKQLLKEALADDVLAQYLPDVNGSQSLNRTFLFNVLNTVKPSFFEKNVKGALKKRNDLYHWKRKEYIEILPELHNLIKNSKNIPRVSRGRALSLLKVSATKKRKRPVQKEKRTLEVHLGKVQHVEPNNDSAEWLQSPGMIKKRRLNEAGQGVL